MLHIKDIEAFARINEALNDEPAETGQTDHDTTNAGPAHPALVMAMLATGRLPLSALSSSGQKPAAPLPPWGKTIRRS
ncbi:hypothetical protein TSH7_00825 [Azospirillum sp. TSH7]|jgi:hypothetical protein|uniref:hypothetical protein n=1 Tax=unclassified Azospirillum TaxID=2630922 RepID=UPI000D611D56|nr:MULTISPECIES: hypothetical protein [unclassified Azospirillum]PWC64755.1 hypothetical protein TSH20_17805 [Azospirillum sp. TSH20]PWC69380.1 hypothetical protein TSH7_00825 [Azospirillum sp. TSH7]